MIRPRDVYPKNTRAEVLAVAQRYGYKIVDFRIPRLDEKYIYANKYGQLFIFQALTPKANCYLIVKPL